MNLLEINRKKILGATFFVSCFLVSMGQSLPSSIMMKNLPGGTFTMGSNSLLGSPDQQTAAPEHQVTLSPFSMSEAEITNAQYVEFLNAAYTDGLIEIVTGGMGPDNGLQLVQGTNVSNYSGKVLYSLDGTRVMKDHDNSDNDDDEFTGEIEPENPLNISYIGFNSGSNQFYVKDPHDTNDFNWLEICNYQDYGSTSKTLTGPILNDFDDWAGAGNNYSDELEGWSLSNPSAAANLPTQKDVSKWPVTFIRWYGAKAFADYYGYALPTEAQWEFAAKGGANFQYAVYDGVDVVDANWNQAGIGTVAYHHVREAISGKANPYGLYNLAGNAWEWIADNYVAPYSTSAITDPLVENGSATRCWRGGSWNYHEATLQSAIRFFDDESRGNDHFGFRIVGLSSSTNVEEHGIDFQLYPNPSNDYITLQSSQNNDVKLTVYNSLGKQVISEQFRGNKVVSVRGWPKGLYIFNVNGFGKKVIIK